MYGESIRTPTDRILSRKYNEFEKKVDGQIAELSNEFVRQIVLLKVQIKELETRLKQK